MSVHTFMDFSAQADAIGTASAGHTYTYLFTDLLTDQLLAELPLSDVTYSTVLNGIGTLSGTIPYNSETLVLDPETASQPGRTALWVDRDGVIVWAGIIWTREDATGGKRIQAQEFLSYFQRRYVKKTLSTENDEVLDTRPVDQGGQRLYIDQVWIVWSLLVYARLHASGDLGIDTNLLISAETGIHRVVTYQDTDRVEIFKAITDLASAADGFDFGLEVGWTGEANNVAPRRFKRMRAWYPKRGRSAEESGLVFSKGGGHGSILDYSWPEDGSSLVTEMSGIGDTGTDAAPIVAVSAAQDLLASGWPLLEAVDTYQGVADAAQVQALTDADLEARSRSATQPTFTVDADTDPAFGSYQVGDEALFVIDPEPQSPNGREGVLRITSIENTSAAGPERVKLTCVAV